MIFRYIVPLIFELLGFTLTWKKLGFKKSSLSRVYSPRFHPVDKWISTVSLSQVKVEF